MTDDWYDSGANDSLLAGIAFLLAHAERDEQALEAILADRPLDVAIGIASCVFGFAEDGLEDALGGTPASRIELLKWYLRTQRENALYVQQRNERPHD
jgi:hypothetical protein